VGDAHRPGRFRAFAWREIHSRASARIATPRKSTRQRGHTVDLVRRPEIVLIMDHRQNGLGSASCGPGVLPAYVLKPSEFRLLHSHERGQSGSTQRPAYVRMRAATHGAARDSPGLPAPGPSPPSVSRSPRRSTRTASPRGSSSEEGIRSPVLNSNMSKWWEATRAQCGGQPEATDSSMSRFPFHAALRGPPVDREQAMSSRNLPDAPAALVVATRCLRCGRCAGRPPPGHSPL